MEGPLVILGSRAMHDLYSHLKITQSIHFIDFRLYACVRQDAINSRSTLVHTYAHKNCMARTLIHGFVTTGEALYKTARLQDYKTTRLIGKDAQTEAGVYLVQGSS